MLSLTGPIIRITPYELHVDDPEFYDTLYSLTDRREKWNWIQARFDVPDAFISTPSHDLHRMRRAPLQSMFSKQKILNFEPYLQETLNKFARVLREYEKDGRPVRLDHAASAFSGDIVSEYAFATSLNSLESKDFADSLQDAFMTATQTAHISLHFQWIIPIMNSLPDKFVLKLQPKLERLFHLKRVGFPFTAESPELTIFRYCRSSLRISAMTGMKTTSLRIIQSSSGNFLIPNFQTVRKLHDVSLKKVKPLLVQDFQPLRGPYVLAVFISSAIQR